ncbi:hypothetical protein R1flu_024386 [Riccia fluitans]|uniref:Myb/SANT-like DNA-binding domain-containing protein n=1 Tax=Riccia fluitans TaxID=41844 RepID=A0ABD1XUR6_9MARC
MQSSISDGIRSYTPGSSGCPKPVTVPPGRDVPLPLLNSWHVVDEPSPGARTEREEVPNTPQMATDEGSSDESGDEEGKKGARLFWHDHMIMALIDIMKEEHHRAKQEPDHARKESDKMKFDRIRDYMKEQAIQLKSRQLRAKWTQLQSNYKKVADHNNKSGHSPYHKMSKQDIKKNKNLPDKFPKHWYNLMDTFDRRRVVMDRDCAISSSEPTMPPSEP